MSEPVFSPEHIIDNITVFCGMTSLMATNQMKLVGPDDPRFEIYKQIVLDNLNLVERHQRTLSLIRGNEI